MNMTLEICTEEYKGVHNKNNSLHQIYILV